MTLEQCELAHLPDPDGDLPSSNDSMAGSTGLEELLLPHHEEARIIYTGCLNTINSRFLPTTKDTYHHSQSKSLRLSLRTPHSPQRLRRLFDSSYRDYEYITDCHEAYSENADCN